MYISRSLLILTLNHIGGRLGPRSESTSETARLWSPCPRDPAGASSTLGLAPSSHPLHRQSFPKRRRDLLVFRNDTACILRASHRSTGPAALLGPAIRLGLPSTETARPVHRAPSPLLSLPGKLLGAAGPHRGSTRKAQASCLHLTHLPVNVKLRPNDQQSFAIRQ
ncbi:hypothetical protein CSOJ01_00243 [Colletotrichum sojae]|uniref:Uncharacterized protein n=1 Tax=Colletotrichum sojae TaxID=2175907 RepID=A0A8H6N5L2_9PEZI|nr:hypothetical protein CSOJ01_00243 [Colletotrichum sojae]